MTGSGPRTVFVTGASRGIGRAIAVKAGAGGANVVVAAKTDRPHPKLPGTIHETATAVEAAGGRALAVAMDVRDEDQVAGAVERAVETFGGIDALVNNAGAIWLADTAGTPMKRYDLMMDVNVRGAFLCTRTCLPWLERSDRAHVVSLCPPLSIDPRWLAPHVAYTISKYGMSLAVIGMAAEFAGRGIAVHGLWPRTVIATEALRMIPEAVEPRRCRTPEIVADAVWAILERDPRAGTGELLLDEEVLAEAGIVDLERYAVDPDSEPMTDLFVGG